MSDDITPVERGLRDVIEAQRYKMTDRFISAAHGLASQENDIYDEDRMAYWFMCVWMDYVRRN